MSPLQFECVEPELRDKITASSPEELDPELQEKWKLHLEICHACRESYHFEQLVGESLAQGVGVPKAIPALVARWREIWDSQRLHSLWLGSTAAAMACVVFALVLPPNPDSLLYLDGDNSTEKALESDFRITRPIEGEVLRESGGELEWTSVNRARFYQITLKSVEDDFSWTGTVSSTTLELPEGSEGSGGYLAIVEPLPGGLVPEKDREVSFRRDKLLPFLLYRFDHLPGISLILILVSLFLAALAIIKFHR